MKNGDWLVLVFILILIFLLVGKSSPVAPIVKILGDWTTQISGNSIAALQGR